MFKNSISNSELVAKSHTMLKELYDNPMPNRNCSADFLTVPETHSHTRLYCPKCMGAHNYENCFKVDGRRSRSRNFKEDQDNLLTKDMKLATNFLKGKQKRKLRYMLSDKEAERKERTRPRENDYPNTFESISWTDEDSLGRKRDLKAQEKALKAASSSQMISGQDDWESKFSQQFSQPASNVA